MGLIEEGAEILEADGPGPVIDAALIVAAQRVEHYEISAYGSACCAFAQATRDTRTLSSFLRKPRSTRKNRRRMRS